MNNDLSLQLSVTRNNEMADGMLLVCFGNDEKPFKATFEGRRDLVLLAFDNFLKFGSNSEPRLIEPLSPEAAQEMQRLFNQAEREIFDEGKNTVTVTGTVKCQ